MRAHHTGGDQRLADDIEKGRNLAEKVRVKY
jgi:hypothetical protein